MRNSTPKLVRAVPAAYPVQSASRHALMMFVDL